MPASTTVDASVLRAAADGFRVAAQRGHAEIKQAVFGGARPRATVIAERYRLLEPLGRGGQGVVWRAWDERLGRDVALKVLHAGDSVSQTAQAWLRHEAEMLSQLSHPNVVEVFDVGTFRSAQGAAVDEYDAVYLVMELVVGAPMQQWIATDHPSVDEILGVLRQVAAGIDAAHDRGLVHSDVKMSNVLLAPGVVKLADFGLAQVAAATTGTIELLADACSAGAATIPRLARSPTRSRRLVAGTPLYMPPEQFDGAPPDRSADVYAFAATMFEALFERPPHRGGSIELLRAAKAAGAPPRPSGARIPRDAYDRLARSLDADPAARHSSASALVADVSAACRRSRWRRTTIAAGCAAVVVVGWSWPEATALCNEPSVDASVVSQLRASLVPESGAAGEYALSRLAQHERGLADLREVACANASQASTATRCLARLELRFDAVVKRLKRLDSRDLHRAPSVVALLTDPGACLGEGIGDDIGPGLDVTDPAFERAWEQLDSARVDWAAGDTERSLAAAEALAHGTSPAAVRNEAELLRGEILAGVGRLDEADQAIIRGFDLAVAADLPRLAARAAIAATGLASTRELPDEGMRWLRHAQAQVERAGAPADLGCDVANARGSLEMDRGRPANAREAFELAVGLCSSSGESEVELAALRTHIAIARYQLGDTDGGLAQLRAAHDDVVRGLGESHPRAVDSLANLGQMLGREGHTDEAREVLERALAGREVVRGAGALSNVRLLAVLVKVTSVQRDFAAATQYLRRIAAIEDRWLALDDPQRAGTAVDLGELLLDSGDVDGADRVLQATRASFEPGLSPGSPFQFALLRLRARIDRERDRPEIALQRLAEAIDLAERWGPSTYGMLTLLLVEAGEAAAASGRGADAKGYAERAAARRSSAELRARIERLQAG
jgi:eukaryotic-like serine/threonine-protein kinase